VGRPITGVASRALLGLAINGLHLWWLLFDVDMAINQVSQAAPDHAAVVALGGCDHNPPRSSADV
jgi:predicted 2-oxoglutarate/Fe(II)-dependent dioxygenase YbiX